MARVGRTYRNYRRTTLGFVTSDPSRAFPDSLVARVTVNNPTVLGDGLGIPILRTNGTAGDSALTHTTASFTPVAGRYLLAIVATDRGTAIGTDTISNTHAGTWTWTTYTDSNIITDPTDRTRLTVFTARVPVAPGAGTFTFTHTLAPDLANWQIVELVGIDLGVPVLQFVSAKGSASTLTPTLAATPENASMVFGAVVSYDTNGTALNVTPGADFTELWESDAIQFPPYDLKLQTQYDVVGADSSCEWTNLEPHNVGLVFEFRATVNVPTATPATLPVIATVGTASATTSENPAPASLQAVCSFTTPTVLTGTNVSPTVLAATATVGTATPVAGGQPHPATLTVVATIPFASPSASTGNPSPPPITAITTLGTPAPQVTGNATASALSLVATVGTPTPNITGNPTGVSVAATTTLTTPTARVTGNAVALIVAATTFFPALAISNSNSANPATLAITVHFGTPAYVGQVTIGGGVSLRVLDAYGVTLEVL